MIFIHPLLIHNYTLYTRCNSFCTIEIFSFLQPDFQRREYDIIGDDAATSLFAVDPTAGRITISSLLTSDPAVQYRVRYKVTINAIFNPLTNLKLILTIAYYDGSSLNHQTFLHKLSFKENPVDLKSFVYTSLYVLSWILICLDIICMAISWYGLFHLSSIFKNFHVLDNLEHCVAFDYQQIYIMCIQNNMHINVPKWCSSLFFVFRYCIFKKIIC